MSGALDTVACEPAEGSIACGWALGNAPAAVLVRPELDEPQPAMAIAIKTAAEIAAAVEVLTGPEFSGWSGFVRHQAPTGML
jgi:hypothetical protein